MLRHKRFQTSGNVDVNKNPVNEFQVLLKDILIAKSNKKVLIF